MRRPYPKVSSVHAKKSAVPFVKAMMLLCNEGEKILKKHTPEIYKRQKELMKDVPSKWKFRNLFTSTISNYNISAPFHQDRANVKGAVNLIFTKRRNASGGCLHVPDYNATIEMADNSMLVYPAYKNMHGVTPIYPKDVKGFRNTHIFYAISGFEKYK